MEQYKRHIGNEEKHIKGFIWMLFMLLMVQKAGARSCPAVCLTWKTENSSLVLICTVDALNFAISFFFGPLRNQTGFCLPYTPCHSLIERAFMEKIKLNDTVDEIIFKIPVNTKLNGIWTCQYGDTDHEAVTEVTLPDNQSNQTSEHPYYIACSTLMMLWCVFGFACAFIIVRVIVIVLTCCNLLTDKSIIYKDWSIKVKYVIVFLLCSTLFLLPVVVGLIEREHCKAPRFFSCYGAILGIICCLLTTYKDKNNTHDDKDHKSANDNKGNYTRANSTDPDKRQGNGQGTEEIITDEEIKTFTKVTQATYK